MTDSAQLVAGLLTAGPARRLPRLAGLVLLGALAALGQAPLGLWPVTVLSMAVAILWLSGAQGRGRAFLGGWALGTGYFAASLHWIVEPFFVDAARDGWMAPFGIVFMAGGMALFWGAATLVARTLGRGTTGTLGLVAALGAAEITRSLILTGFPWALLGHIWIDTRAAALAAIGGPHLLTLLTLGLAAGTALLIRRGGTLAFGGSAALFGAAFLALAPAAPPAYPDGPVVRLVQPNAQQDLKWAPGMAQLFYERLLTYTAEGAVPDLVVWPETALQYLLETSQPEIEAASDAARGAPVVTGIVRRENEEYFNSLIVIGRGGRITDIYDKWHLVPFGEYFPAADLLDAIGLGTVTGLVGGGFGTGPGPSAVSIPGIGRATALICYEGIFAEEVNAVGERPRLILLITNDAWFGDWAGPAQHFAQARLRAIEQGLPVVRVANTGISGMIDGAGRVTASLPLGAEGAFDAVLPPALSPPPYTWLGDWPALALTLLLALLAVVRRRTPTS